MKLSITSGGLVLTALAGTSLAGATYRLSDTIVGTDFYIAFTFEAIPDPTNGRVNYVDQATAQCLNLTDATPDTFIMRADDTTVLSPTGPGRNSVRIRSINQYTTHVAVFDMLHMPEGCGTWPAVWETSEVNWPIGGEVDIVEGVNNVEPNQSTLHTSPNCSIPSSGVTQLGTTISVDCDAAVNGNQGCAVASVENSFGPSFNSVGGGLYALERTDTNVSIWFWQRGDPSTPIDATTGAPIIDTSSWGIPAASFPSTGCDLATHLDAHNIIINLTFCGSWAGLPTAYAASGCPSTCVDYVNSNPAAFTNAYFQFNSIRIYESNGYPSRSKSFR